MRRESRACQDEKRNKDSRHDNSHGVERGGEKFFARHHVIGEEEQKRASCSDEDADDLKEDDGVEGGSFTGNQSGCHDHHDDRAHQRMT